MADIDIELFIRGGGPQDAIREDRTLDIDLLVSRGWTYDGSSLAPPPVADELE
jgi:hypothetical protein